MLMQKKNLGLLNVTMNDGPSPSILSCSKTNMYDMRNHVLISPCYGWFLARFLRSKMLNLNSFVDLVG